MTPPSGAQPGLMLGFPLLALAIAASGVNAAEIKSFNIPAGTADKTLKLFTTQSGAEVVYPAEIVRNVKTTAVKGEMTIVEAIERLLAGSVLRVQPQKSNTSFIIFRAPSGQRGAPRTQAERPSRQNALTNKTPTDDPPRPNRPGHFEKSPRTMKKKNAIAVFLVWLGSTLVSDQPASAADGGSAGSTAGNAPAKEEAVVLSPFLVESTEDRGWRATNTISATRVNMPLVNVPQTISVLTADFLKDVGAFDLHDAAQYVSSVGTTGFQRSLYNVRGFAVGEARRNGVPFRTEISPLTVNVDRVEFVKGPSSALYGVGSPGGVVNYVTKLPLAERQAEASTAFDSEGSYRGSIDLTGPLTQDRRLRYRFIGLASHKVGTKQFDFMDEYFMEPTLQWFIRDGKQPTILTVTASWDRVPDSNNADERWPQIYELRSVPLPNNPNRMVNMGVAYAPGLPDDFNMPGPNSYRYREATALFVDIQHTFNDLFNIRLAYNDGQSHNNRITQFPVFVAGAGQLTFETAQSRNAVIDKVAFYGDTDTWDRLYRFDLNYRQEFEWMNISATAGVERRSASSDSAIYRNTSLPPFPLYDPQPSDYDLGAFPINYGPQQVQRNDSEADQYNLVSTAQLFKRRATVLAGVSRSVQRYSSLDRADSRPTGSGPLSQVAPNLKQPNNYAAGVTFEFLPGVHGFYSYSESSLTPSAQFPNDPQSGRGIDYGVRVQKGRFSGSVTIFDVERINIVRSDPTQPTGSSTFLVLSGMEESTGWEAEVFYFPTDDLQIMMNYTDMEPVVVKNTQAPITEGRTIDGAYPKTFNLFAKYSPAKGVLAGWFFSAGVNYYSKTLPFGTNEALTLLENPAYTLWQAGFGYRWRTNHGQWVAGIHGSNLADEFYYNDAAKNGQGRVITGTLTWRY